MSLTGEGNLTVTQLDFGGIKQNFIEYLRTQDQFKDYDFEGSGMSVILDLLAYNTHYQSFYANMVANEMFLDSAVKRTSITSRAKEIGYVPRSYTAASATIDITVTLASNDETIVLPRYTQFTASGNDGITYRFSNLESVILQSKGNNTYSGTLDIHEGSIRTITFIVDNSNPNQRFVIPDINVDTTTLTVRVQTSASDTTGFNTPWNENTNFNILDSTSEVYFVQENYDGYYEIEFGDGIVGKKPSDSNVITIQYLVTSGPFANNIGKAESLGSTTTQTFTTADSSITSIAVVSPSAGGAVAESESSIKYYAPLSYQAQDRAVTSLDYQAIVARDYADSESVSVWGGEDNDPPFYGRVFVSIKPNSGTTLTASQKETIVKSILEDKNLVTVTPIVVDPEYTYLRFNVNAYYNPYATALSKSEINIAIISAIRTYIDSNVEKFGTSLKFSKLAKNIDDANQSIESNYTTIELEKRFIPTSGSNIYEFRFQNPIYHPHDGHSAVVRSSGFSYNNSGTLITAYLDDSNGYIRLYYLDSSGSKVYVNEEVGTIDYDKGFISLTDFTPVTTPAQEIKIFVQPKTPDVDAYQNNILTVDISDSKSIEVNVIPVSEKNVSRVTNTDFYTSRENRLSSE